MAGAPTIGSQVRRFVPYSDFDQVVSAAEMYPCLNTILSLPLPRPESTFSDRARRRTAIGVEEVSETRVHTMIR